MTLVKQDEYVEECLDRAARNVAYIGAAAVGIAGLIAFAIIGPCHSEAQV